MAPEPEDGIMNGKNPWPLEEDDIALLKTYGLGPYSNTIKKVQKEIKEMAKTINDLCGSTNKELAARARLAQLCSTIGWKHPTYDFEEQGVLHTKLFTTVHVETFSDTIVDCFSDRKPQKKAAQEQAAQGVLPMVCSNCLNRWRG